MVRFFATLTGLGLLARWVARRRADRQHGGMASPDQFFGSGYPPRPPVPADLGMLRTGGKFSAALELTVPQTVFGAARLSATSSLRAVGHVTREPVARDWLRWMAAGALFALLFMVAPAEVVSRLAACATVAGFLLYLYDRSK